MNPQKQKQLQLFCWENCRAVDEIKMATKQMSSAFFVFTVIHLKLLFFKVRFFMNAAFIMDEAISVILETLLAKVTLNDKNDKQFLKSKTLENQTEDSEFDFEDHNFSTSKENQSTSNEMKETMYKTFNISNCMRLYESQDVYERKGESESESEDDKARNDLANEMNGLPMSDLTQNGKKFCFITSTPNRTPIFDSNIQFKSPDEISNIIFEKSLEDMDLSDSSYETVYDSFDQTPTDYENTEALNLALQELIDKPKLTQRQDAAIQTILTEKIFLPSNYCQFCRIRYLERDSLKPLCLEYPSIRKQLYFQ